MASKTFDSAKRRAARAQQHISSLQDRINAFFFSEGPYRAAIVESDQSRLATRFTRSRSLAKFHPKLTTCSLRQLNLFEQLLITWPSKLRSSPAPVSLGPRTSLLRIPLPNSKTLSKGGARIFRRRSFLYSARSSRTKAAMTFYGV